MVGKNHLHRFFSHFRSIFSKIMRFSNPVISEFSDIHGLGPMFKRSISGTLPPKCNRFPWKFLNFEISSLESDRYASPKISNYSVFSQCSCFSSSLCSSNDRLMISGHSRWSQVISEDLRSTWSTGGRQSLPDVEQVRQDVTVSNQFCLKTALRIFFIFCMKVPY